jgi:hypothetical protein
MILTIAVIVAPSRSMPAASLQTERKVTRFLRVLDFAVGIWSGLNAVALGDTFSTSCCAELLTFAAVPLVCVKGYEERSGAPRYMLFALIGRYFIVHFLIYGAYGTLDIACCSPTACRSEPAAWTAAALMTVDCWQRQRSSVAFVVAARACRCAGAWQLCCLHWSEGSFILIVRIWFDAARAFDSRPPNCSRHWARGQWFGACSRSVKPA